MPRISVFEMLKVGVGPSSSHTLGPWRAAQRFLLECAADHDLDAIQTLHVELYGSLAKTGKGHGTDIAVLMGLLDLDPTQCDTAAIPKHVEAIQRDKHINLQGRYRIPFNPESDLIWYYNASLSFHPNGLRFIATLDNGKHLEATYFSIGGGFVVSEGEDTSSQEVTLPYPCDSAEDVERHCVEHNLSIGEMVWRNEMIWRDASAVRGGLLHIWQTMRDCVYRGCHTTGELPGGLRVTRRANQFHKKLIADAHYSTPDEWLAHIQAQRYSFAEMVRWISCFALAVNEENAAFGRVVTAPTNGAAGVLPAVLMYYVCNYNASEADIIRFLLVAGDIGSLFKKGATISAALGGCQAEIGVSSAMAAAGLAECLGGTPQQALMAAEIAMEHHLGLTCDPIGGLVQIPCIERNAIGAMKAITAANIALESDPSKARVSLDGVIKTMWETALDMHDKYKETAEGGLAVHISVNVAEC